MTWDGHLHGVVTVPSSCILHSRTEFAVSGAKIAWHSRWVDFCAWCFLQSSQAPTGAITWLDREAPEPTAGMITHAGPKSDDPLWRD